MQQRHQAAQTQHHERQRAEQGQEPQAQWSPWIHRPIAVVKLWRHGAQRPTDQARQTVLPKLTLRRMPRTIAISGASGKTGYRVAEEVLRGGDQPRLLLQERSVVPESLQGCDQHRLRLGDAAALDAALQGADALVIATGARPSIDLTTPLRVDAWGVEQQVRSCERVGVQRVVLVSSLCAGRWLHPLNLFGLILVWKRLGEQALERSRLDWTVIRPGGLSEREDHLDQEGILYSGADQQDSASIPRRLVARCCLEALNTPASIGQIIEITSRTELEPIAMEQALAR